MRRKTLRIGITGLTFDAAHYTPGVKEECLNLHGHTFRVDVEVEGPLGPDGMVMDFSALKEAVRRVLEPWDHALVVPEGEASRIELEGPFKVKLKIIKAPAATTEHMALAIAEELHAALGLPVRVRVWEGEGKYAEAEAR